MTEWWTQLGAVGFEPTKAMPTGLQPVPFDHLGIPPGRHHPWLEPTLSYKLSELIQG